MTDPTTGQGSSRTLERAVGASVLALALLSGAHDLRAGLQAWDEVVAVSPGEALPAFEVRVDDGSRLRSDELRGRVALLTFWATWCHACDREMPTIIALDERYDDEQLKVYGINRDSGDPHLRRAGVEAHMAERGMNFAQIYDDGTLARAFGVEQIPYMVVIDKRGEIRHLHLGQVSERALRREIDALLAE